jgi:hypothetical protein
MVLARSRLVLLFIPGASSVGILVGLDRVETMMTILIINKAKRKYLLLFAICPNANPNAKANRW